MNFFNILKLFKRSPVFIIRFYQPNILRSGNTAVALQCLVVDMIKERKVTKILSTQWAFLEVTSDEVGVGWDHFRNLHPRRLAVESHSVAPLTHHDPVTGKSQGLEFRQTWAQISALPFVGLHHLQSLGSLFVKWR